MWLLPLLNIKFNIYKLYIKNLTGGLPPHRSSKMIKQCTFFSCNDWDFLRENIEENIDENKFKPIDADFFGNERIGFINFSDDNYILTDDNSDNFVIAVRIEKRVLTQQIIDNEYQKYYEKNKNKDKDKLLAKNYFADELRKKALCKSDVYFIAFSPSVNLIIIGATGVVAEEIRCLLLRSFDFKTMRCCKFNKSEQFALKEIIDSGRNENFMLSNEIEIIGSEKRKVKMSSDKDLFGNIVDDFNFYEDDKIKQIGLTWINKYTLKPAVDFSININDLIEIKKISFVDLDNDIGQKSELFAEIKLICKMLVDLFATFGGLHPDLFDDFQQTLAADENIHGASVTVGGKEKTIYKKTGVRKD